MLHLDDCGLKRAEVPGLVEALQALVFCLHELRLESVEGAASKPSIVSEPASPSPAPPLASGAAPAPPPPPKRIVTLQQRLLLAQQHRQQQQQLDSKPIEHPRQLRLLHWW